MAAIKTGIGYSPLTEKIYLGKQNPKARMWVGEKTDITNDFLNVLFLYIPEGTSRVIKSKSKSNFVVNIVEDADSINRLIDTLNKKLEEIKTKTA